MPGFHLREDLRNPLPITATKRINLWVCTSPDWLQHTHKWLPRWEETKENNKSISTTVSLLSILSLLQANSGQDHGSHLTDSNKIRMLAGSLGGKEKYWEQGRPLWAVSQVSVLGIWTSLFCHYGNECWKLSRIQSQLDRNKYEMKGHMMIKPLTDPWKKTAMIEPSFSWHWGSSDPWLGHLKGQGQLAQIHNSASLLQSYLHKWLPKSHKFKSKLLFSTSPTPSYPAIVFKSSSGHIYLYFFSFFPV